MKQEEVPQKQSTLALDTEPDLCPFPVDDIISKQLSDLKH